MAKEFEELTIQTYRVNKPEITIRFDTKLHRKFEKLKRLHVESMKLRDQIENTICKDNNITSDEFRDYQDSYDFLVDAMWYGR